MATLDSPEVRQTIAEANALGALLTRMTHGGSFHEVAALVRPLWALHRPRDPESWLRHSAMAKLIGEPIVLPELVASEEATSRLFVRTARAWILWATGRTDEGRVAIQTTVCEPVPRQTGGEIHLMALGPWCWGVAALLKGDREEARRYFRRSTEVGSQLGTDTNNAIQWAYVATFLEHKP